MIELTRRSFLKIAIATIATPVIARAAVSNILLPGMERVDQVRPRDLAEEVRFANAIHSYAATFDYAQACEELLVQQLPYGMAYEMRAVRLSAHETQRHTGVSYRKGYAILWVVAPAMQRAENWDEPYDLTEPERYTKEYVRLGRSHAGTPLVWRPPEMWIDEQDCGGTIRRVEDPTTVPVHLQRPPMTDAEIAALDFEDEDE